MEKMLLKGRNNMAVKNSIQQVAAAQIFMPFPTEIPGMFVAPESTSGFRALKRPAVPYDVGLETFYPSMLCKRPLTLDELQCQAQPYPNLFHLPAPAERESLDLYLCEK